MSEYFRPRTEQEVERKRKAAEIDLRNYLVALAEQGLLASFGFREGSKTPSEEARFTNTVVQQALRMRPKKEEIDPDPSPRQSY